ncbi:MAG: M20/M25/M40 family metallo-hydrolase [Bacteroidota bacterium]
MKSLLSTLIISLGTILLLQAQETDPLHGVRVDVVYLASDYLEGRETGTQGEALAAAYIAQRFEALGLTPANENEWFQPFKFNFSKNPHAKPGSGTTRTGKNVVGFIDNKAETTVIIGAHYDHIGHGHYGSRTPGDTAIHNGADDNASGVAAIIEVARQLTREYAPEDNNYLFIAFSGEEMGLYGSKHYAKKPLQSLESVNYMLNFDMVGRMNAEKTLVLTGAGTSPSWKPAIENANKQELVLKTSDSGIGPSDHTSFYLKDIPVLHFFTGQHDDYHKPVDDSHLINFEGIQTVATYAVQLIRELEKDKKLAFTKTKDEQQGRRAARFKVSLGIMPDYTASVKGLRIDAVLDGRPAQKAGLADGDIITQMGEKEITDIYTYMEGLAQFDDGDTAKITVKRGDETVEVEVQF